MYLALIRLKHLGQAVSTLLPHRHTHIPHFKMQRIFVYGSLKRGQSNGYLMENDKGRGQSFFLGQAITHQPYPMVVAGRYNTVYILDAQGKGKHIKGEVHEVDNEMMKTMDELEGYPDYYQRDKIKVHMMTREGQAGSEIAECWCYLLRNFKPELLNLETLDDFDSLKHGYIAPKDRPQTVGHAHRYDVLLEKS